MTPPELLYPAPHLSDADVQRETYAGVKVLLERTADLPEIRAKVIRHDQTLKWYKWGIRGALASVGAGAVTWLRSHLR